MSAHFSSLSPTIPLSPVRAPASSAITTKSFLCWVQYRGVVDSMVDSPISVIRIAVCLSFRLDIICGTPFDVQLGLCANISALSPTIPFPPVRVPTLPVVTTIFSTDASSLLERSGFSYYTFSAPPLDGKSRIPRNAKHYRPECLHTCLAFLFVAN